MNRPASVGVGTIGLCVVLLFLSHTIASSQDADSSGSTTIFLPAIFLNHRTLTTPSATATRINMAPTHTPTQNSVATATAVTTQTPTATATVTATVTVTATATVTATVTATAVPTDTPMPTATASATATNMPIATPTPTTTASRTPIATPTMTHTATATVTPTATATATTGPTPTTTATSIPFPEVTFSCRAEPATGNALRLILHAELSEAAPVGGASFRLDFTGETGPIDAILRPLPFQLINFFAGDTARDATGFLSKCDQADQCTATYTVTQTSVTRYIGTAVDCQY